VSGVAVLLGTVVAALWLLRRRLGAGVGAEVAADTWGCGYAYPTARMAYTGSSFAQILNQGFRWVLLPRIRFAPPRGLFPTGARFSTEPREAVLDLALLPRSATTSRRRPGCAASSPGGSTSRPCSCSPRWWRCSPGDSSGGDMILRAFFQIGLLLLLPRSSSGS